MRFIVWPLCLNWTWVQFGVWRKWPPNRTKPNRSIPTPGGSQLVTPHVGKAWVQELSALAIGWSLMIIHSAAKVTHEGHTDNKVVGSVAAIFYDVGGRGFNLHQWTMGMELKYFDVAAYGLTKIAEALVMHYMEGVAPPHMIVIFGSDASAMQAVTNTQSKSAHAHALMFLFFFFGEHFIIRT
ncbi:hypothetical protein EI94DRAFT_1707142 [Lactarius quietus]|nr:hypothetical protein EI94DRAFT_1707142 [Lactarius quietus]